MLAAALACLYVAPRGADAQSRWRDLVVTLGGSLEGYTGNFSAVAVPVVDSTERATAAVGEIGVRGSVALYEAPRRSVDLTFDGGMRQAAATGFTLRDYAPREWAGTAGLEYRESLGTWGSLTVDGAFRGRSVEDRPPMPLFLQPGYATWQGGIGVTTRAFDGVGLDVRVHGLDEDYRALEFVPQLDLLDRQAVGVTAGVRWGTTSRVRVFGTMRWSRYPHLGSFDPTDPIRRDRTLNVGLTWTYAGDGIGAQLGLDGTRNRSNGKRPEYDAISARALFSAPLPWRVSLNVLTVLTGKSYVNETTFARLVPGEEADNASIAYVQFTRPLADNLDGAVRFGWTRAETDIGSAYYRRFGGSVHFNFRPRGF